jgi:hypothetical protein
MQVDTRATVGSSEYWSRKELAMERAQIQAITDDKANEGSIWELLGDTSGDF